MLLLVEGAFSSWLDVGAGRREADLSRRVWPHRHQPGMPDEDFAAAVKIAQAEFDRHQPDAVVGSSRGGAVAMNIQAGLARLVLLCPAWKRWGSATSVKPGTVILHSEADDVVPIADSRELLTRSGLPQSALRVVGTDHRLADPAPWPQCLRRWKAWDRKAARLNRDPGRSPAGSRRLGPPTAVGPASRLGRRNRPRETPHAAARVPGTGRGSRRWIPRAIPVIFHSKGAYG